MATIYTDEEVFGAKSVSQFALNEEGILLAAYDDGLLFFDGERWDKFEQLFSQRISGITFDQNNRIWLNYYEDLGYLHSETGKDWEFKSLSEEFPDLKGIKNWSDIYVLEDGSVFFCGQGHVARFSYEKGVKKWSRPGFYFGVFELDGTLYTIGDYPVVNRLEEDGSISKIMEPDAIIGFSSVYQFTYLRNKEAVLFASPSFGLVSFDGETMEPFAKPPAYLADAQYNNVATLANGDVAAVTVDEGIHIYSPEGQFKGSLQKIRGISLEEISSIKTDLFGGLWIANVDGIHRLDMTSPLSLFDGSFGHKGQFTVLLEHENTLYAGSSTGLYRLLPVEGTEDFVFEEVGNISNVHSMLSIGSALIIGSKAGLFVMDKVGIHRLHSSDASAIEKSPLDDGEVYFGGFAGLHKAKRNEQGKWVYDRTLRNDFVFYNLLSDADGRVWIQTGNHSVAFFIPGPQEDNIRWFGKEDGLTGWIMPFEIYGEVLVGSDNGIYAYDEDNEDWIPDQRYEYFPGDGILHDFQLVIGEGTERWVPRGRQDFHMMRHPGVFFLKALWQLDPGGTSRASTILQRENGTYWLANDGGVVRYNVNGRPSHDIPPTKAYIRRIIDLEEGETLFLGVNSEQAQLNLETGQYDLRFVVGSNDFRTLGMNGFRFRMEPYHDDWPWYEKEHWKDFTNLSYGKHRLSVVVRNGYGETTSIGSLSFVNPFPWYLTPLALISYTISALLALSGFIRWRSYSLKTLNR